MTSQTTVIEEFLADWKERATKFYNHAFATYRTFETKEEKKSYNSQFNKAYASLIQGDYGTGKNFDKQLEKMLNKEVESKSKTLVARIKTKAGEILNAEGLQLGVNGEINGKIIGTEGTVHIQTIYAGGHNIQQLHYRVLVK